nr:aspartic proteinase-like protein 2 isoform X1 [Ipomoea batatas]
METEVEDGYSVSATNSSSYGSHFSSIFSYFSPNSSAPPMASHGSQNSSSEPPSLSKERTNQTQNNGKVEPLKKPLTLSPTMNTTTEPSSYSSAKNQTQDQLTVSRNPPAPLPFSYHKLGSSNGRALAKIGIGTPPLDYYVQVDIGSDIMWVNCIGCSECPRRGYHGLELSFYNPKDSVTGELVLCNQKLGSSNGGALANNGLKIPLFRSKMKREGELMKGKDQLTPAKSEPSPEIGRMELIDQK